MKYAYYNEIDPFAAAWLRQLIAAGHIAPGEVDGRSIEDVTSDDLRGFTQCHFFAGIGVWSYSLRCAGWPDDRPVWTGSCPCQPFSAAGKRAGVADERHLWPAWFHLISICRPPTVFGEQVASKDGLTWLDLVHSDLEGQGYAVGCLDLCAAGFGAPHLRQRLYFVAESGSDGRRKGSAPVSRFEGRAALIDNGMQAQLLADTSSSGSGTGLCDSGPGAERWIQPADRGELGDTPRRGRGERGDEAQPGSGGHLDRSSIVGNPVQPGLEGHTGNGAGSVRPSREIPEQDRPACTADLSDGGMADTDREHGHGERPCASDVCGEREPAEIRRGPCNGFWRNAVWLPCRDGKARPVGVEFVADAESGRDWIERQLHQSAGRNNRSDLDGSREAKRQGPAQSIIFPLAHGAPARVGRLRGYGNAIVAPVAKEFVEAYLMR